MPSFTTLFTLATLAVSSLASTVDPHTPGGPQPTARSLEHPEPWTFGQSKCPQNDGDEYTGPKGGRWRIRCGYETEVSGHLEDISPKDKVSFETCIQTCGKYPERCQRATFVGDVDQPGMCYLKDASSALVPKTGVKQATKLN